MRKPHTQLLTPLIAAAALMLPAAASADTFCVNAPGCPAGGVSTGGDLQAALDGANAHSGADTVLVGDKGSPYTGPFTYQVGRVIDPVTIKADGGGRPVLTSGVGDTAMTLDAGTLDGIDIVMPSAAEGTGVAVHDATLHDVTVSSQAVGPGATAILDTGQSVLNHVRVTATGDVGLAVHGGQLAEFGASVTAHDLQISGCVVAVDVNPTGRFNANQSQLTGATIGVHSQGVSDLDRVAVATSAATSTGIVQSDGSLALNHVTVAHEGLTGGADTALSLHASTANRSFTMNDSALAGYTHGIERAVTAGHTLSIATEESVWNPAGDQLGPVSAGALHELGDVHTEPALVDLAGGDLRPRGSSAQIDLDTVSDPSTYTDLNGTPTVDGNGDGIARPDAGALEYRHLAPTITTIDAPAGGIAGTPLAFNTATRDTDGDHVQVRWDFGDGATATDTATSHVYAAPGSYQAALTATDEARLTERRTFTVTIAGGGSTGGNPSAPSGGTPTLHRNRLVLRELRLNSTRISVKRAGRLRLRFTANQSATIRIVAARRVGPRTVRPRAIVRHVSAGPNSIAMAALLRKLRLLKPGRLMLTVTASDISGSHTQPRTLHLTLRR